MVTEENGKDLENSLAREWVAYRFDGISFL